MMRKILTAALILFFSGAGIGFVYGQQSGGEAGSAKNSDIPAYHTTPPTPPLPATLDPKQFPDAQSQNLYALAAKVKAALYQQPCYCRCDLSAGHKSLLDCYRDKHGSICDTCKKEAAYVYTQTKKGETAEEIRKEIMAGKHESVDLTKYDTPLTAR
jgi:hypothetical protein